MHYPRRLDTITDEDFLAPARELEKLLDAGPLPAPPTASSASSASAAPQAGMQLSGKTTVAIPKQASVLLLETTGPMDLTVSTEENPGHTVRLTKSAQLYINPLVPGSILTSDSYLVGKKLVFQPARPVRVTLTWS